MSHARTTASRTKPCQSVIVNRCPGCGGDIELRDEYDITRCSHCASLLRVVNRPDLPAYFLRDRISLHEARAKIERLLRSRGELGRESISDPECWLIPYWHFQGQLLRRRVSRETIEPVSESDFDSSESLSPLQERERIVSNVSLTLTTESCIALEDVAAYPTSLSLGQQIVRRFPLVNMGGDSNWQIATPRGSSEAAIEVCRQRNSHNGELFEGGSVRNPTQLFIHESMLLFVPFYSWRDENNPSECISIDATTGELHTISTPVRAEVTADNLVMFAKELRMIAHRCSRCSADLSDCRSLVYRCDNCGNFTLVNSGATKIRAVKAIVSDSSSLIWFPFWQSDEKEVRVVVPAFSFRNFEVAYRVARQLRKIVSDTCTIESIDGVTQMFAADIPLAACPAFRAAMEGRSTLERKASLEYFSTNSIQSPQREDDTSDWSLIYIPFRKQGYEYTDAVISAVTFPAQSLA
jgi:DNA-directed RNA polymerase subunit RPC12/RpoP